MKKLHFIAIAVLVFATYLIFSYNKHKGHSYIHEPIYISLKSTLPENTRVELNYTTINNPVTPQKASLLVNDSIDSDNYIFKIDSSYRLKDFRLFFFFFQEEERFIITEIEIFNTHGEVFNFSLKSKDLVETDNLRLEDLNTEKLGIRRVANTSSVAPSLYFHFRGSFSHLFVRTNSRVLEIPSLLASLLILVLSFLMVYTLYPTIINFKFKGISPGAYLLALVFLILPTGEKISNLLLIIVAVIGLIISIIDGSLRDRLFRNRTLLFLTIISTAIYTLSYLFSGPDKHSGAIYFMKLGLPLVLFAIILNIRNNREIRLQFVALLSGAIVSVFIHFGWIIIFVDSVGLDSKLIFNPLYYLESSIFSRVHHSFLSVIYLFSLSIILFRQNFIRIANRERIIFSLLIVSAIFFAFSRAAILSLALILFFHALRRLAQVLKYEITHAARFVTATALTLVLFVFIAFSFELDSSLKNSSLSGINERILLWENASDIIKQKPLMGWGTYKYNRALHESNKQNINYSNYGMGLGTHNQFLETSGMFGIVIGIGLIWFLLFPTGFSKETNTYSIYLFSTALIFITVFLFESFLSRNLGILIFGIVYGLSIKLKTEASFNQKHQLI